MSRERAKKYGVPIFRTVDEALTLGGDKLAVDGVLLIGEHGDYPRNEKAQKLYPRFEMFLKITDVFRQSGRSVPGVQRQAPLLELPAGEAHGRDFARAEVSDAGRLLRARSVARSRHRHAVRRESRTRRRHLLQRPRYLRLPCARSSAMHGRAAQGRRDWRARRAVPGKSGLLELHRENGWAKKLFDKRFSRSKTRKQGTADLVKEPAVFIVDYNDGLGGGVSDDRAWWKTSRSPLMSKAAKPVSTLMNLQNGEPHHHFGCLVKNIEMMFETGKPPYPVERTLLTSGILDFALESRFQGYKKLDTPQLAQVRYQTPNASHFCTTGWGPDGKRLD